MRQELVNGDLITVCHDLWVNGQEVPRFDPSADLHPAWPLFALKPPLPAHLEAMSADTLLTRNASTGPVVTHEPGPDLRFYL